MSDTPISDAMLLAIISNLDDVDDLDPPAPEEFAQELFVSARQFGRLDQAYADLVEESTLAMRSGSTAPPREFKFGDDDMMAEGDLGPGSQIVGTVSPDGPAQVRIFSMAGSIDVDADPLGRFEADVAGRVVRIVVTRGQKTVASDWYLR